MLEKRKDPRLEAKMELHISSLFKQDNDSIKINSPITITDVSKGGIGFISDDFLPIGYYFNADLQLGHQNDKLYCVVRIVRSQLMDGEETHYLYGCEFVGMAPVLDYIFDEYAQEIEAEKQ